MTHGIHRRRRIRPPSMAACRRLAYWAGAVAWMVAATAALAHAMQMATCDYPSAAAAAASVGVAAAISSGLMAVRAVDAGRRR